MTAEMRILTVRQPWAWAIMHGKDVENRVRNIAGTYRGPIAIHVAQQQDRDAFSNSAVRDELNAAADRWYERFDPNGRLVPPWQQNLGRILGVVDLVDVHDADSCQGWGPVSEGVIDHFWCSPWAEVDAHHLVLADPRPLREPIPYRGALGLRTLDPEMTARILAQIGDPDGR